MRERIFLDCFDGADGTTRPLHSARNRWHAESMLREHGWDEFEADDIPEYVAVVLSSCGKSPESVLDRWLRELDEEINVDVVSLWYRSGRGQYGGEVAILCAEGEER